MTDFGPSQKPGVPEAMDGNKCVVFTAAQSQNECESNLSDIAHICFSGRLDGPPLVFVFVQVKMT